MSSSAGRGIVIVLCINLMLFWAQIAIEDLNPGGTTILNYEGSPLSAYDAGGYVLNQSTDVLPTGASSISPTTGNIFTDTITSMRNWVSSVPGVNAFTGFLLAIPNFIKLMGMPQAIEYGIGSLWYGTAVFFLVSWIWGRQD